MKKILVCESCEAEFIISHEMSDEHYQVKYCAFCSEEIELEDSLASEEDEDDEWEG
jgi:hypothetical protein